MLYNIILTVNFWSQPRISGFGIDLGHSVLSLKGLAMIIWTFLTSPVVTNYEKSTTF